MAPASCRRRRLLTEEDILSLSIRQTTAWTFDVPAHTSDDRAWDSDLFATDGQFSMTFDEPGTYGYFCVPHGSPGSGMIGTVVVVAPEDAAPPEMAPPAEEAPPEEPPAE